MERVSDAHKTRHDEWGLRATTGFKKMRGVKGGGEERVREEEEGGGGGGGGRREREGGRGGLTMHTSMKHSSHSSRHSHSNIHRSNWNRGRGGAEWRSDIDVGRREREGRGGEGRGSNRRGMRHGWTCGGRGPRPVGITYCQTDPPTEHVCANT